MSFPEVEACLPSWRYHGGDLSVVFRFDVFKDGELVDQIDLTNRPYTILGRNPDHSHVLLDHPSISRKHAVVYFSDEERIFIMDLKASHHTYLNAQEIDPLKHEIEIINGDKIMFGKSSRVYELVILPKSSAMQMKKSVPPVPAFEMNITSSLDAPVRDRVAESSRLEREKEIAEFTAEVEYGSHSLHGKITAPGRERTLSEMAQRFGISNGRDEDKHEDDDDENDGSSEEEGGKLLAQSTAALDSSTDLIDAFAQLHKIPVSHQVDLSGFSKAVTCLAGEPSGNRIMAGSSDFNVKLFDFGGMDSRHNAFRTFVPEAGHPVAALSASPSGDRVLIATGNAQPKVFDREGKEVLKFVRGDMYLRDMANTKGHTMEVTSVCWHPTDKNWAISGSLDGTLRIWDLAGTISLGQLVNKTVLKIRSPPGGAQGRIAVTSCCYSSDGSKVIAGCVDGSIHIWAPPIFTRTFAVLRPAHGSGSSVTCVATSGGTLASRGSDGTVLIWALTALSSSSSMNAQSPIPIRRIRGLESTYASANVDFSPDGTLLVAGGSPTGEGSSARSTLSFYKIDQLSGPLDTVGSDGFTTPCLQIGVLSGASVVAVKWIKATNQILCSTSSGAIRVFFDPKLSNKGAILSAGRIPARSKDPMDFAGVGQIINPHALPMYRDDSHSVLSKKKREADEKRDPLRQKIPAKAPSEPIKKENSSFFFTRYATEGKKVSFHVSSLLLSFLQTSLS